MAGHSKWAKIKRDKATNDAKRGTIFTKLGNQIAVAARGGTNPDTNPALAMAVETAKSFNMPQTTINRAIRRAQDRATATVEEVIYEGYGHHGLAILVECATDNRKRTYPEVKSTFSKNGGNIAEAGAVLFNFKHCGEIIIATTTDEAMMQALEAGAEDVLEIDKNHLSVVTKPGDLHKVLESLKSASILIEHASLTYQPRVAVSLEDLALQKATKLIDALEALNDVVNVYNNLTYV